MKLRFPYRTIRQCHNRDAFPFTPSPLAVQLAQSREFADPASNCERFDVHNFAADLEEHPGIVAAATVPSVRSSQQVDPESALADILDNVRRFASAPLSAILNEDFQSQLGAWRTVGVNP